MTKTHFELSLIKNVESMIISLWATELHCHPQTIKSTYMSHAAAVNTGTVV